MCGKSFFIATNTATTSILDGKQADPTKRLAILLGGVSAIDFSGSKHTTAMDKVYMGTVRAAQPDPLADWITRFRACVGTIVLYTIPC